MAKLRVGEACGLQLHLTSSDCVVDDEAACGAIQDNDHHAGRDSMNLSPCAGSG